MSLIKNGDHKADNDTWMDKFASVKSSLSPKGECRIRELVMLRKEALDNGLQKKNIKKEELANVNN